MNSKRNPATFAIILGLLLLTSCRFGNYSESPKGIQNFKSIDLYRTQMKKFETFVIYQDDTQTQNQNVPLSAVPSMILDNFTNPLYIAEPVATPGVNLFIGLGQTNCMTDPANSNCIGTLIDQNGDITVSTNSDYSQFGSDPACTMNLQMQQLGYLDQSAPGTITYSDGSTGKISGDLLLDFRLIRNFKGNCSGILQILADCYSNGAGCSTDELYWANQLFDLYIRQSSTLKIEDVTRIKTLAYIVHFD